MPKLSAEALQERRQQILSAAGRMFAEKGYDRTTVRDLEAATGLSRGGIFGHFGSKMALFRAALDAELEAGLMPALRAAAPEGTSAEDALMASFRAMAAWNAEHADAMRLAEQSRVLESTEPELAALELDARARRRETVVKNVRDRQTRGIYRATADLWAMAELIQIVQDRLLTEATRLPRDEAEAKAERVFAVLAQGVQPKQSVPGQPAP